MSAQGAQDIRRAAAVVFVLVVTVLGSAWYLGSQRPAGDRNLARSALEGLTFITFQYANPESPHEIYASGLREHHEPVDLYLGSDSAARLPEVTSHIRRAWDAFLLADELWRLYRDGEETPLVADVVGAAAFAESSQEFAALAADDGSGAVLDNSGLGAVRLLFEIGAAERGEASALLARGAEQDQ